MSGNNLPLFSRVGDIQWTATDSGGATGPLKTAVTAVDGTGNVVTAFTADATNGGRVEKLKFRPVNGAGLNNVQTVARVFINNGSTNATPANNVFFTEVTLPATTGSASAALADVEVPLGIALPPGYKINVTLGTTVVAGYYVAGIGGKY